MPAAAATAARDGQTSLALRLAKHLASPPPSAEDSAAAAAATTINNNVAFSPLSVHAALALAAAGARGATQAQLLAFLGAPSAEELADFSRRVADRVLADRSDAGGPRVLFGGGVWVDAGLGGLTDAFRNVAAEVYKSEARTLRFAEERDLIRLGLSLPFSQKAADLRGMCNGGDDSGSVSSTAGRRPTFLSKVAHKAVVKVNEVGTEAATVSVVMVGGGPPAPGIVEFVADHPFTFFIMEELSGVIVFAGHVLDPTK